MVDVKELLQGFQEKYGESSVYLKDVKLKAISTGSLSLDVSIGIGGIPKRRFTEIYGPEGTGKTSVCLSTSREVIKLDGRVLYIDAENALDYGYVQEIVGRDVSNDQFVIINPEVAEDAFEMAGKAIQSGLFDLIVLDSLPALAPKEEKEKGFARETMMVIPRLVGKFFRLHGTDLRQTETALIIVNQVRDNTKSYFGGYKTPGGHALKHWNSLEIQLTKGKAIEITKDGIKTRIGQYTNFTIKKNKVAIPYRTFQFPIIYGKGIDYIRDSIEFSAMLGVIKKKGSWYYFNDEKLGQGLSNTHKTLKEDENLLDKIQQMCYNLTQSKRAGEEE